VYGSEKETIKVLLFDFFDSLCGFFHLMMVRGDIFVHLVDGRRLIFFVMGIQPLTLARRVQS
jgi:hypothetical protein